MVHQEPNVLLENMQQQVLQVVQLALLENILQQALEAAQIVALEHILQQALEVVPHALQINIQEQGLLAAQTIQQQTVPLNQKQQTSVQHAQAAINSAEQLVY